MTEESTIPDLAELNRYAIESLAHRDLAARCACIRSTSCA
jgi:hypothetical protein